MLRMKAGYSLWANICISFVLLVHPSCCLLLGSQQLFCSDHSLTAGAEYLVLLGGSATPAHPWCVWVFLQAVPGLVPAQPHALPLQRLLLVQAGAGLPRAWCDTVTHRCYRHSGEQGCVTTEHPKGTRGFL